MCFGGGEEQSVYTECSFDRSEINGPTGGNARFENCSFRNIDLTDFSFHRNEFINCTFTGNLREIDFQSRLYNDDLQLGCRQKNEFYGNNFSDTRFFEVKFDAGIDLTLQNLPKSDKHIIIMNTLQVLKQFENEISVLKDGKLKTNATGYLKMLKYRIIEGGQEQYLLELSDNPDMREVEMIVCDIVERLKK